MGTRSAVGPGDSGSGRHVDGLDSTDAVSGGDCVPLRLVSVELVMGVVAASGDEGSEAGPSPETLMEGFCECRPAGTVLDCPGRPLTLPLAAPLGPRASRGDSGDDLEGGREERMAGVTRDGAVESGRR